MIDDARYRLSRDGKLLAIPKKTEKTATQIIDAAFAVHSHLGPGLLETVYESCLLYEFRQRKLSVQSQLVLPILYDGVRIDAGLRVDAIVNACVLVELKAVEKLPPVHSAQVLTYLKLTSFRLGLLFNFNVALIRDGIRRLAL